MTTDTPAAAAVLDDGRRDFTDADGRRYVVRVSVGTRRKLIAALGIDIAKLIDEKFSLLEKITGDLETMVNVLWVTVEDQARAHGLDEQRFAESLLGDCVFDAGRVLCLAIADFFPDRDVRAAVREVMKTAWQVNRRATELAGAKVRKLLAGLDVETLARKLTDSPTGARASSAPTRRRTR